MRWLVRTRLGKHAYVSLPEDVDASVQVEHLTQESTETAKSCSSGVVEGGGYTGAEIVKGVRGISVCRHSAELVLATEAEGVSGPSACDWKNHGRQGAVRRPLAMFPEATPPGRSER